MKMRTIRQFFCLHRWLRIASNVFYHEEELYKCSKCSLYKITSKRKFGDVTYIGTEIPNKELWIEY